MVAVDESGFPITYDWDAYSGTTVYNASNLPPQLTAVTESSGTFTLTASTTEANAGSLVFRGKASDGVLFTPSISTLNLTFTVDMGFYLVAGGGSGGQVYYTGAGGGGAGQVLYATSYQMEGGTFAVTIGAGGIATGSNEAVGGQAGGNSSVGSLIANGGGFGGGYDYVGTNYVYSDLHGGSGGGFGAADPQTGDNQLGGLSVKTTHSNLISLGNIGGAGGPSKRGAGGGGAGAAGSNAINAADAAPHYSFTNGNSLVGLAVSYTHLRAHET